VPESKIHNVKDLHFRAKLPYYFRFSAIGLLCVAVIVVTVGFFRERNRPMFHLLPKDTQLSKDVIAEVNSYERLETDGDKPKYYVKADKATTVSDNHQEMENVFFQLYDDNGNFKANVGTRPLRAEIDSKPREQFTAEFPEVDVQDRGFDAEGGPAESIHPESDGRRERDRRDRR